jgi:hypothetical protein
MHMVWTAILFYLKKYNLIGMRSILALCIVLLFSFLQQGVLAQSAAHKKHSFAKGLGPLDFPELIFTKIKGAPTLQMPQLIMGETAPVKAEGMGFAVPAWLDVNDDGKNDLLLGEFGSRLEDKGIPNGNFVRVYENEGTKTAPRFSDIYSYLRPVEEQSTGTPLSIYTWCCIGFSPKIVDLNNDGYKDVVTGQYNPGLVTWFRGSESGFLAGQKIPQFADENGAGLHSSSKLSVLDPAGLWYWNYSAVDFGDFDGKGLQDMIVGGAALRISKNIGTKSDPRFGRREMLLDTDGNPLKVGNWIDSMKNEAGEPFYGASMVPTVDDWDMDGIPDLLVTDTYTDKASVHAITFFRAVKSAAGLRFEPGVPLFTAKNGGKSFPGSWLRVCVADYNNDGVNDLLIGTSVATLSGKFDHELSWKWETETDIVKKDPAYNSAGFTRIINNQMKWADSAQKAMKLSDEEMKKRGYSFKNDLFKHYYSKEAYKKLAHQGYVYVLLGTTSKQN